MYFLAEILLILDYDDGWLTRVKISVHSQIWGEVDIPSLKHVLNFLKFPDCDKKKIVIVFHSLVLWELRHYNPQGQKG